MIAWSDMLTKVRTYVLKDTDAQDEVYSDEALMEWLKEAAHEIVRHRRWLLVDADGNPRGSSTVITNVGADIPEAYEGALLHGCLMFVFAEDQQRSSFERGLFNAQLGQVSGGKR